MKKKFLTWLGFIPKEGVSEVFIKKYYSWYSIEVDFEKEVFNFWGKILVWKNKIQNITKPEDWVVFECVNRLLEKGYNPEDIVLEQVYPSWHGTSWRLDVLVKNKWDAFLMIECKTWGKEFDTQFRKMEKDWGQLFTYYQQDRKTDFLVLYTSNEKWEYKNEIVKVEDHYKETTSVPDFYDRWNKLTKQNGIFEDWIKAYHFESRALTKKDLKPIKQEDASIIFNSFLEILRKNTVSDKPNAFNKIFTLFLCKIYDEGDKRDTEELNFQWIEWKDNNIDFQLKLSDLYKKGMQKLLEKEVTDLSNEEFNNKFWWLSEEMRIELLKEFNKIRLEKNNEFAIKDVFDKETFEENAIVLKEVVELLQIYQIRYEEKQPFLGDFFELLLTTWLKQEAGQFFTPVPVAKFICKSIPIEWIITNKLEKWDNDDLLPSVIDYAAWSGHFLTESMEEIQTILKDIPKDNLKPDVAKKVKSWDWNFDWAYDYMYGIEKDYRLVKTAKVWCFLHWDWIANVIHWDGLDSFWESKKYRGKLQIKWHNSKENKDNGNFDLVLSNPPYSVWAFKSNLKEYAKNDFELFSKLTEQSSEIEALFIERTSQLLKEGWIAWIILPSSILSNTWIYTKAREIILKDFEIIAITELGSNTFMATGTNTVTLFLKKRNKFFAKNLEHSVSNFFENLKDITLNGVENAISKYVSEVWGDITFDDYKSLLEQSLNDAIKNHEIFKDYENKLKLKNVLTEIIEIEKEKLFYFVLAYPQKVVFVKSWEKKIEKEFLWYEFSNRKWSEGIHPIQRGKSIDECTKLFDPEITDNPEKASTYIYDAFQNNFSREINPELKDHIFRASLSDLLTFDRTDFEKTISLNLKKKVKIDSKWEIVKIEDIKKEIINWKTPSKNEWKFWDSKDINWFTTPDYTNNINIESTSQYLSNEWWKIVKIVPMNSVLVSCTATIWKVWINRIALTTNQQINSIVCNNKILPEFLANYLRINPSIFEWLTNNSWVDHINLTLLNSIRIPLPPLDIQQKIIDEIWELEKIEKRNWERIWELQENIENFIWSVSWEKFVRIWEIAESLFAGGDLPVWNYIKWQQPTSEFNVPIYSNWLENNGLYWFTNIVKVTQKCITISARWTIWFPIVRNKPFYPIVRLLVLIPKATLAINKYLAYCIKNLDLKQFWATTPQLTVPQISDFKVPLPPLETQKKIVAEIEVLEWEIEKLQVEIDCIPEKKKKILKKYL